MRYVALLRGVSPTNCPMPALARAFESAGWKDVSTFLASGNVVFEAPAASEAALEKKAEAAVAKVVGREFLVIVRPQAALQALLASDPFRGRGLAPNAKRVVTFLREAPAKAPKLPMERDEARVLALEGRELYTAYVPNAKGPVFMKLIEEAVGKEQTTRTWQTVEKLAVR